EGNLEWVDINDVLKLDMPYTSKYCLSHYLQSDSTDENIFCGVATEEGVDWSKLHYF
ncbi:MAG: NUDIX hydrolase, partial [Clostridiales bacterium]|nr:NUDIX hydrolase [Clostridiales bacterium]